MKGLLFTYVMTYGGAVIALFNPFVGLLVYVCFAIIKPEALWYWSVPAGNYSRIIALSLLAGWGLKGFGDWKLGRVAGIAFFLVAFQTWMAVSALGAEDQPRAWHHVEEYSKIVLPFLVGVTLINSLDRLRALAWVLVFSEGYLALEMNRNYFSGFNSVREIGFATLDNNGIAITMVTAAGLAFFLGLSERRLWARCLGFAAAGLAAHVVLFSNSRGGMVALILSGIVSFILIRKKPSHYVWFLVAVAVGVRLAGPPVIERFSTMFADADERDTSAESRLLLSKTCLQIIRDYPLFGVGPAQFGVVVQNYGWPAGKEAHTTWLQAGAEEGIPGMFFLLSFFLLMIARAWSLMRTRSVALEPLADIARMVIAGLVGYMISAQFVTTHGVELPYYIVLLGAGAVKIAPQIEREAAVREEAVDGDQETETLRTPLGFRLT